MRYFAVPALMIVVFLVYCLIPNIWLRNYSKTVLRYGNNDGLKVALTFDDGPNPEYTPQILGILKKYGVKATFFVVGKNALLYSDIIMNIQTEGHTIGTHSYSHIHAWLLFPFSFLKDLTKSCSTLRNLTGKQPQWYRPPWGTFNILIPSAAKKLRLSLAYWSISARDWESDVSPERIANTVLAKTKPGAIIVLHDNGDNHSSVDKTVKALPIIIESLKSKGYQFVTLDELGGKYIAKNFD